MVRCILVYSIAFFVSIKLHGQEINFFECYPSLNEYYSYSFSDRFLRFKASYIDTGKYSVIWYHNGDKRFSIRIDSVYQVLEPKVDYFRSENVKLKPLANKLKQKFEYRTGKPFFILPDNAEKLGFQNVRVCDFSYQNGDTAQSKLELSFIECYSNNLILSSSISKVLVIDCSFNHISFINALINEASIHHTTLNSAFFLNSKFTGKVNLFSHDVPKVIKFQECDFSMIEGLIHFPTPSTTCSLYLYRQDISKFQFNYKDYIVVTKGMTYAQKQSLYKDLKDQYLKLGMHDSYEAVDIDSRKLEYQHKGGISSIGGWISWWWWKFGYEKEKVLKNAVILFVIFFLSNVLIGLPKLLNEVYSIDSFKDILIKKNKSKPYKNFTIKTMYTFLFTCFIFWGLNLDKKMLKIENVCLLFYLLLQYIVGVICLAYLGAYILSR